MPTNCGSPACVVTGIDRARRRQGHWRAAGSGVASRLENFQDCDGIGGINRRRGTVAEGGYQAAVEPFVATGFGPQLPKLTVDADLAPPLWWIFTPSLTLGALAGAKGFFLTIEPVLRVAGPVAEDPHPRPELGCNGAHPQV